MATWLVSVPTPPPGFQSFGISPSAVSICTFQAIQVSENFFGIVLGAHIGGPRQISDNAVVTVMPRWGSIRTRRGRGAEHFLCGDGHA